MVSTSEARRERQGAPSLTGVTHASQYEPELTPQRSHSSPSEKLDPRYDPTERPYSSDDLRAGRAPLERAWNTSVPQGQ
jgi:hypothetical protein